MCVTPEVAIGLQVAGTLLSAYSTIQTGKANSAQAAYQAQVARNNQTISEWKANDAIERGQIEEDAHRKRIAQLKGRQTAVLSANGVVIDADETSGSILQDTAELGELDALTIRSNAEREAFGHRLSASNTGAEASLLEARAANDNSFLNAGAEILTGGGAVADKWYRSKKAAS